MLVVVVYLSFYEGLPGMPGGFLTTAHYVDLIRDRLVLRASTNTLIYTMTAVFISLLFGVLIAWLVERTDIGGRGGVQYGGVVKNRLLSVLFAFGLVRFPPPPHLGVLISF